MLLDKIYRWCDPYGGGLIIAESYEDAQYKLSKMFGNSRLMNEVIIWPWLNDDYFDNENPDVFDVY